MLTLHSKLEWWWGKKLQISKAISSSYLITRTVSVDINCVRKPWKRFLLQSFYLELWIWLSLKFNVCWQVWLPKVLALMKRSNESAIKMFWVTPSHLQDSGRIQRWSSCRESSLCLEVCSISRCHWNSHIYGEWCDFTWSWRLQNWPMGAVH